MHANATTTPSRLTEKLSARNGPRHSVYWVKTTTTTTAKRSDARLPSHANVLDASGMGSSAARVEYTLVGKYTGEWQDGVKHGYGVLVYANGNKYEGDWRDGQRDGRGVYWVHDKRKKKTTKKTTLRKQYAGEWRNDQRHGLGTFFQPDGSCYEGYWQHNHRDGDGRMVYGADRSVYEGQWSNNERSGRGMLTLANGDVYDGYWLHDKKEGPGRFYYKASGKLYEGEWVDGAPQCGTYYDNVGLATATHFGPDDSNPLSRLHRFELPELELAHPEQVVSESIARIRQDRVLDKAFRAATLHDDDDDDVNVQPFSSSDNDSSAAVASRETSVVFDDRTMRLIQHQFTAIEQAQATNDDAIDSTSQKQPRHRPGCVQCNALPQLVGTVGLRVDATQLRLFLAEIGATPETFVSFAECVDILSLLAESEMGSGDRMDDASEDESDDDDDYDDDA